MGYKKHAYFEFDGSRCREEELKRKENNKPANSTFNDSYKW